MQQPVEPLNYIFNYDLSKKVMGGFRAACKNIEEVKTLDIAKLESQTVRSGWIKFTNNRNDRILNQLQQAKWVLRFPKGDPAINEAWKRLIDLVTTPADKKVVPSCTDADIRALHELFKHKSTLKPEEYQKKWNALSGALKMQIAVSEPLNAETVTYFSKAEVDYRTQLILKIDELQSRLKTNQFDPLETQIRAIRQSLSGNFL